MQQLQPPELGTLHEDTGTFREIELLEFVEVASMSQTDPSSPDCHHKWCQCCQYCDFIYKTL